MALCTVTMHPMNCCQNVATAPAQIQHLVVDSAVRILVSTRFDTCVMDSHIVTISVTRLHLSVKTAHCLVFPCVGTAADVLKLKVFVQEALHALTAQMNLILGQIALCVLRMTLLSVQVFLEIVLTSVMGNLLVLTNGMKCL